MSSNTVLWTVFMLCLAVHQSLQFSDPLRRLRKPNDYQNMPCATEYDAPDTCLSENDCISRKETGRAACGRSSLICCTFLFTCSAKTSSNETLFVNPSYPWGQNGTNTCQVNIQNTPDVCQLRLDFEEFRLSPPDQYGRCTKDRFEVRTTIGEPLPILCGENEGQHMYVDIDRRSDKPVVLSVITNGTVFSRIWKIKTSLIPCNNSAPSGCLQYFREPSEVIRSFNYKPKVEKSRNLSNLTYTSCIRVEKKFCAIKWQTKEANSYLWGASDNPLFNTLNVSFTAVNNNVVISRSNPFLLKVRPNNVKHSQNRFLLRYDQLPCVN